MSILKLAQGNQSNVVLNSRRFTPEATSRVVKSREPNQIVGQLARGEWKEAGENALHASPFVAAGAAGGWAASRLLPKSRYVKPGMFRRVLRATGKLGRGFGLFSLGTAAVNAADAFLFSPNSPLHGAGVENDATGKIMSDFSAGRVAKYRPTRFINALNRVHKYSPVAVITNRLINDKVKPAHDTGYNIGKSVAAYVNDPSKHENMQRLNNLFGNLVNDVTQSYISNYVGNPNNFNLPNVQFQINTPDPIHPIWRDVKNAVDRGRTGAQAESYDTRFSPPTAGGTTYPIERGLSAGFYDGSIKPFAEKMEDNYKDNVEIYRNGVQVPLSDFITQGGKAMRGRFTK
jgi:hypothetical protein